MKLRAEGAIHEAVVPETSVPAVQRNEYRILSSYQELCTRDYGWGSGYLAVINSDLGSSLGLEKKNSCAMLGLLI